MKSVIYTIGRQYGSGGHEIGEKLAKKLDIPFYDSELIALAAPKIGLSEEASKEVDEKHTNTFAQMMALGAFGFNGGAGFTETSLNDKLYVAQSQVIKDVATQGSCVIVGRCADYVLRDIDNVVRVFVYGNIKNRIERIATLHEISHYKAEDAIKKKDKIRGSYYNYYTNRKWDSAENYDLMLSTDGISTDDAVDLIRKYAEIKFNKSE